MRGREEQRRTVRDLWWRNGLIWLALMALLAITLIMAYIPLGPANTPIGIGIAVAKACLVVLLFMELVSARPLIRLAAIAGLPFVTVMFALTLVDVLMRYFGQ